LAGEFPAMGEISEPGPTLSWAAGGIALFLGALLSQLFEWMRLPAGKGFSGVPIAPGGKGPEFPKNSRLVTAVILLGAIALPLLPIGREARNTVAASWRGFRPSARDRAELAAIAAQAEKEKDARELAFVALSYPDPDRAIQFADRATTLDPSLVWIYASRYYGGRIENLSRIAVRLKRVENSDPETPASDNEWMKEMEKAFRAPRYDGYYQRHEEWIREGGRKTQVCPQGWWRSACGPAAFRMRSKCRHMRICGSSKPCKRPRREMWMRQKPC
jgi:hypothetical protein